MFCIELLAFLEIVSTLYVIEFLLNLAYLNTYLECFGHEC